MKDTSLYNNSTVVIGLDIVQRLDNEWGIFKVSALTDFWVLEWTDNHSNASNCCFEDIDPMPYDISEQEIIWQVDKLLL